MTAREPLHSTIGRFMLVLASVWFWFVVTAVVSSHVIPFIQGRDLHLPPGLMLMQIIFAALLWRFSRWARRNATPVWMTDAGIELTAQKRVVPWSLIGDLRDMGNIGGVLIHLHELTFRDGTPRLIFYAHGEAIDRFTARRRTLQHPATSAVPKAPRAPQSAAGAHDPSERPTDPGHA